LDLLWQCIILLYLDFGLSRRTRYVDTYGVSHDAEKCSKYCCGSCNLRYCCKDKPKQLNQESCSGSSERCGLLFNLFS
uniref:Shisa N-terminal domain-containing protein n=1 Tax=Pundamilia nyererei TaxID=303518 RepID=A0A3B4GD80_9CICH